METVQDSQKALKAIPVDAYNKCMKNWMKL